MKNHLTLIAALIIAMTATAQSQMISGKLGDWHSHNVTDDFLNAVRQHDALMDENFPIPQWSEDAHLAFMDSANGEWTL